MFEHMWHRYDIRHNQGSIDIHDAGPLIVIIPMLVVFLLSTIHLDKDGRPADDIEVHRLYVPYM